MPKAEKDLKSANTAWLWSIAALDAVLLLAVQILNHPESVAGATALTLQLGIRVALTAAAPVAVLLLTSILPTEAKSVLVFWRIRDVLPSHRAFSVYVHSDPRIGVAALKKNIGKFPEAPGDQSSTWYKLYRMVESDVSVRGTHRHFLLFCDLSAMSVLLLVIVPATLCYFVPQLALPAAILFSLQYLLSAIAGRQKGIRMVTTVLALHSAKKYT